MSTHAHIHIGSNQGVREGTMDRIFNLLKSQTLGTGLKGTCKNLAVSNQSWGPIMNDVTQNHA